jgi:guanine deaminase
MERCDFMKDENSFILKGNIIYSESPTKLICIPQSYLICMEGKVEGVYQEIPSEFENLLLKDHHDALIIPGLVDLHTHAPQYANRGLGMDQELLHWLEQNTFPEEEKYADLDYAKKAYSIFAADLRKSATTRASIFGTIHKQSTLLLMDLLETTGLGCMVGKVNMDRNSPAGLCENRQQSMEDTLSWLMESKSKYRRITPVITPRFLPSCTDELLKDLSRICRSYQLPLQSHLSENLDEIDWVKELFPRAIGYADAYSQLDLFGNEIPTIMAHCVHLTNEEMGLIYKNKVFIAHCPTSNTNLSSGIAPIRAFMDKELLVGLGTDIAAGNTLSIFQVMVAAIQASKLRWRLKDQDLKPLTIKEAFYLGTKGGGSFFGKVGSFEKGYEFDAIVLEDNSIKHPQNLSLEERLERVIYLSDDRHIKDKYVNGNCISLLD